MGFWHTGYIEFHEPVGLEGDWNLAPARFPCLHCGQTFSSADELRKHRFEAHPLRRPVMFLDGRELGTQRVKVTRAVDATQIRVEGAERALLNGNEIAVCDLGRVLAKVTDDVCQISLSKYGVEAQFELEIRVASEQDLRGVEEQFTRMARSRRLDMRAVEEFILGASRFRSAMGYCDGICAYLYGMLAKERAPDCSLPYKAYSAKYARAAEELSAYDRKLARTIAGVVAFHFNHFQDAERLCPASRLGRVASRYAAWIDSRAGVAAEPFDEEAARLETLVTDWESEQIVRWASRRLDDVAKEAEDISLFLKRDLPEFDRVKLHILLGELHAAAGNVTAALEHAKALRNLSAIENWAEALIRDLGDNK